MEYVHTHRRTLAALVGLIVALASGAASATAINASPATYAALVNALRPGDTLQLASGTYPAGLQLTQLNGTAAQPIIIQGPSDKSAVFTARICCNTVELDTASYIEVRNLTLDGLNLEGVFGVNSSGPTHNITIDGLMIVNHGFDQQTDGISTKASAWNWVIRNNTIIGAGTGIYLGNSDGSYPFVAGLIENNLILDTIGYNMEIKHQLPRPTNLGLPTGDSKTVIRNNVFSKQNNASGGIDARPNLLVGHFPLSGAGANDVYEIYGNFFYQNPSEALFQGEGNIALYDNLFVNAFGDAVNIEPQNDVPRFISVFHNTAVATGNGLRVSGAASGYSQRLTANAVFAGTALVGPNQVANVSGNYAAAVTYLNSAYSATSALDLFPKAGQLRTTTVDLTPFASFTDYNRDFNATVRSDGHAGAYDGDGSNPGWKLARALKATAATPPPAALPTLSLSASPVQVARLATALLQWSTTNVSACTASGGWSGARVTAGSEATTPLTADTAFTLTCSGSGGTASQTVTVTLLPPPTVSLSASSTTVQSGANVTLTWSSANATGCTAADGWSGSKSVAGSESVGPLQATGSFRLNCSGAGGSANQSVTVTVSAPTPPAAGGATGTGTATTGGGGALSTGPLLLLLALAVCRRRRIRNSC